MKNILFLVTGMTPQIITETLWALACDPDRDESWLPDEIHVLSTESGLDQIRARLFNDGFFAKMQADYPILANVKFSNQQLHSITQDGIALKDLKTPADNELAADAICAKIQAFTQEDTALHVSIAGGRKTMGFYAGYALSLYGRPQDRLSHVLVDGEFESARDFYYPTPSDIYVEQHNSEKRLNAKNAQIWLAEIPFVRMRGAIIGRHQLKSDISFSEVVKKINQSYEKPHLSINLNKKENPVTVNNEYHLKLEPQHLAFLYWFADLRKNREPGIQAPRRDKKDERAKEEKQHIDKIMEQYERYYRRVKIKDVFDEDSFKATDLYKTDFNKIKSKLKEAMEEQLGIELASRFEIMQDKRQTPFYLNLDPDFIEIID